MARPEQSDSGAMMIGVDEDLVSKRAQSKAAWQRQWRDMVQKGIVSFMAEEPERFRQWLRRGIPMEYRWEVWKAAAQIRREGVQRRRERAGVGERLESSDWLRQERGWPGLYQELLAKENQWSSLIEIDISRTFPEVPLFDKEQQQSLLRVLQAYANFNPEVGYCQGMNFVAGLLLLVSQKGDFRETPRLETEEETFWMFASLMRTGICRASTGASSLSSCAFFGPSTRSSRKIYPISGSIFSRRTSNPSCIYINGFSPSSSTLCHCPWC